ncbi:alpha/beta hydrolase fold domain-containing protein [Actinoplanes sp. NPDC049596]|uniref:alpha/beta hydrolase fold domain-containing protein n=1 Tax=unclassified Actinoplanes TaxID=2626549 RepID=UPI003447D4FE
MIDNDLAVRLSALPPMPPLDAATLTQIRPYAAPPPPPNVNRQEVTIPGSIPLAILRPSAPVPSAPVATAPAPTAPAALAPATPTPAAPCVYWIHGGGMVMGNRYSQIDIPLEWLTEFGAVVVSVDYRLAPEAHGSEPVDDCYRGLTWVAEHADELGIDPARLVVAGASAGGGLAAGVTLMARDRGGPAIAAQVLIGPMLDHRTRSDETFEVWTPEMNAFAWRSLLGDSEPTPYVSPARAADLSGLPPTYVDAGSAELFRDEAAE